MKVDTRNRYTVEERSMILAHMLDLPIDGLASSNVDLKKLLWLKLKVMADDTSDRAQVAATRQRWIVFITLVVAGLATILPQLSDLMAGDVPSGDALLGVVSPVAGFAVALYIVLHPLYAEKNMFEPSVNSG